MEQSEEFCEGFEKKNILNLLTTERIKKKNAYDSNGSPFESNRPDLVIIKKKKRSQKNCQIMDFLDPAEHKIKLKVSERMDRCLNLVREQKIL